MGRRPDRSVASGGSESRRFTSGGGGYGRVLRCDSRCWRPRRQLPPARIRFSNWCCGTGSGCGSAVSWMRRPRAWSWRRCADNSPAGQRVRVSVLQPVRYAPEFRWAARAGARSLAVGPVRRTPLPVRQQAKGPSEAFVLGSGRLCDLGKTARRGQLRDPSGELGWTRFEITVEELGALLSGIDLSSAVRRKRYRRAIA